MSTEAFDEDEFLERVSRLSLRLNNAQVLSTGHALSPEKLPGGMDKEALQQSIKKAEVELEREKARNAICAALKSASNDLTEISKIVGTALLPLALAGAIALPVTPLAFAVAALVVYRTGVAAYCSEVQDKQTK